MDSVFVAGGVRAVEFIERPVDVGEFELTGPAHLTRDLEDSLLQRLRVDPPQEQDEVDHAIAAARRLQVNDTAHGVADNQRVMRTEIAGHEVLEHKVDVDELGEPTRSRVQNGFDRRMPAGL
jgi:hypothetical protein